MYLPLPSSFSFAYSLTKLTMQGHVKPKQTSLRAMFGLTDPPTFPVADALEIEAATAAVPLPESDSQTLAPADARSATPSPLSGADGLINVPASAALPATLVFQPRSPQGSPAHSPRHTAVDADFADVDDGTRDGLADLAEEAAAAAPSDTESTHSVTQRVADFVLRPSPVASDAEESEAEAEHQRASAAELGAQAAEADALSDDDAAAAAESDNESAEEEASETEADSERERRREAKPAQRAAEEEGDGDDEAPDSMAL
jgi:hypothetical protein